MKQKNRPTEYPGTALADHVDAPFSGHAHESEPLDSPRSTGYETALDALRQFITVNITLMKGDSKPEDKLASAELIVIPLQMKVTGFTVWQPKGRQTEPGVTGPGYNWTAQGKTIRMHIVQPLDPRLKGIPSPVQQVILAAFYEAVEKARANS